jgi:hypothetical protein
MSNIIRIKRRAAGGGSGAPSSLENAELAFNEDTDILYYGKGTGGAGGSATSIIPIAGSGAFAPLNSPALTGTPTAPTATTGTNTTQIATTAFVQTAVSGVSGVSAVTATAPLASTGGLTPDISITQSNTTTSGYLSSTDWNTFNNKAPTASPTFTGTPTAPTAANTDNSTQLATTAFVKSVRLDQLAAPTSSVTLNNQLITNLLDPTNNQDAATKAYVDSVAQGLNVKQACLAASTVNIPALSGLLTIDGITLSSGDRVLVKNQTAQEENGIYIAASGGWARSPDANTWDELRSAFTFIEQGSTQADTGWVCTVNAGGTLGVTAVTWAQFSGAGTYTAGTGLTLTGNQFSITNTGVTAASYGNVNGQQTVVFSVNAQGQITTATAYDINVDGGTF